MVACPPSLPPQIKPGTNTVTRAFVTPDAVHPLLFRDRTFDSSKLKAYYQPQPGKAVDIYAPHFDQQGIPLSRNNIEKHTKYMQSANTPQGVIRFQTSDYKRFSKNFKPNSAHLKGVHTAFAGIPDGHYHLQHKVRYE